MNQLKATSILLFVAASHLFFSSPSSIAGSLHPEQPPDKPPVEDKRQLEADAKRVAEEAKALEARGQLNEAEEKYLAAEAITSTREGLGGLERVRRDKYKKEQTLFAESHGLYDAGKTQEAIAKLDEARALEPGNPAIHYNLALSYIRLDNKAKAISELDQCLQLMPDNDKNRGQLEQMRSALVTGEKPGELTPEQKGKIDSFNASALEQAKASSGITDADASITPGQNADAKPVPCSQLNELQSSLPKSPALFFNLAKCAEEEGRQDDALHYLDQYLAAAPTALDSEDVRLRVATDTSLIKLDGPNGEQVRRLYAAATREIDQRKYDRAMEDLNKADQILPDYSVTKWRLALLYEAQGNVAKAREYYASYQSLETSEDGKKDAASHLENLEKEREQYDSSIQKALTILTPLLAKSMNPDRQAAGGKTQNMSYEYVQAKLDEARGKLDAAAALFPLGPEVNELFGIVYLQGNNPTAAMRCYDIVASQRVPVSFYGSVFTAHDRKEVKEVKVELWRDNVRLIYLSSYNPKQKKFEAPGKPSGRDSLGNLTVANPDDISKDPDEAAWKTTELKAIETKNNYVALNTGSDEVYLSPLNLTYLTPYTGTAARKFGNNYSRLFLRYVGYDNTKLGPEHMTGGEKFALGMSFAAAGMGGYAAFAGGASMMTTNLMMSMSSLNTAMNALKQSRADQRQFVNGNDFKIIPSQSFDLAFKEKFQ